MSRSRCVCGGVREEINQIRKRLLFQDYNQPAEELAQYLLGKVLVRKFGANEIIKGMIVETEAYLGVPDKASHSYLGKVTTRNKPMFMCPGTAYVYFTYGMYHCFNISSQDEGAAVLIRALEPLCSIDVMRFNKENYTKVKKNDKKINHKSICIKEICNGPSKMCMAFNIDKQLNMEDLVVSDRLWIEDNVTYESQEIFRCSRIGLGRSAEEWMKKPLRYYVRDNEYISKKGIEDA